MTIIEDNIWNEASRDKSSAPRPYSLMVSKEKYSIRSKSDYQTIPGYSDILEAKLTIDDYKHPQVSNYDFHNIADLNG